MKETNQSTEIYPVRYIFHKVPSLFQLNNFRSMVVSMRPYQARNKVTEQLHCQNCSTENLKVNFMFFCYFSANQIFFVFCFILQNHKFCCDQSIISIIGTYGYYLRDENKQNWFYLNVLAKFNKIWYELETKISKKVISSSTGDLLRSVFFYFRWEIGRLQTELWKSTIP